MIVHRENAAVELAKSLQHRCDHVNIRVEGVAVDCGGGERSRNEASREQKIVKRYEALKVDNFKRRAHSNLAATRLSA